MAPKCLQSFNMWTCVCHSCSRSLPNILVTTPHFFSAVGQLVGVEQLGNSSTLLAYWGPYLNDVYMGRGLPNADVVIREVAWIQYYGSGQKADKGRVKNFESRVVAPCATRGHFLKPDLTGCVISTSHRNRPVDAIAMTWQKQLAKG